jgi:hypothetical protein
MEISKLRNRGSSLARSRARACRAGSSLVDSARTGVAVIAIAVKKTASTRLKKANSFAMRIIMIGSPVSRTPTLYRHSPGQNLPQHTNQFIDQD